MSFLFSLFNTLWSFIAGVLEILGIFGVSL